MSRTRWYMCMYKLVYITKGLRLREVDAKSNCLSNYLLVLIFSNSLRCFYFCVVE